MKSLRIVDLAWLKAQFQFEPRDLWIGLFWRINREMRPPYCTLHIYLCLIPLVPLHITILLKSRVVQPSDPPDAVQRRR